MAESALISADELQALLGAPQRPVLLDCSFDLGDSSAGARAYARAHIPGAHYVHLDHDLSAVPTGVNGRHPLRERAEYAQWLGSLGIAPHTGVVVYDDQGGMFAVRAWWVLRWMGHADVRVLNGGLSAWQRIEGELTHKAPSIASAPPYPAAAPALATIQADQLLQRLNSVLLIDARAPERYRGDVEPLDPVAGHIPGARNRHFRDNLQADGCFKPVATLRTEFTRLLEGHAPDKVVHYCGSGVSSCHNLLAMELAGLGPTALYAGSWSEWCADPARPISRSS